MTQTHVRKTPGWISAHDLHSTLHSSCVDVNPFAAIYCYQAYEGGDAPLLQVRGLGLRKPNDLEAQSFLVLELGLNPSSSEF